MATLKSIPRGKRCILDFDNAKRKNEGNPIVVSFSNGRPEEYSQIKFETYVKTTGGQSEDKSSKLVTAKTDKATYINNFEKKRKKDVRFYVGFYDKSEKRMKVVPTEMYELSAIFSDDQNEQVKPKAQKTKREEADELTSAFGSKRKRQAVESRLRHQVETEEITSLVKKTAADIDVVVNDVNDNEGLGILPTVNWQATDLKEVYNMQEILTLDDLDTLQDEAKRIRKEMDEKIDEWQLTKVFPEYVINRLRYMTGEKKEKMLKIKLLLYMHHMIILSQLKYPQFKKKDPFGTFQIPSGIKQKLLETFCQKNPTKFHWTMPLKLKDKLTAHILVLGLAIDNFRLDFGLIPEFKIAPTRVKLIARAMGAKMDIDTVDNVKRSIVSVKLPLPKPLTASKKRNKKS